MNLRDHRRVLAMLLAVSLLIAAKAWALGPQLQALQQAAGETEFIWYGYEAADSTDNSTPEAVLFTATDSSWLLFEKGGGVSTLGPSSRQPSGQRKPITESALAREEFDALVLAGSPEAQDRCRHYGALRASLEQYWEARRLWQGNIAMAAELRLELFNAANGSWVLLVRQIDEEEQACIAHHGLGSRWVQVSEPKTAAQTTHP